MTNRFSDSAMRYEGGSYEEDSATYSERLRLATGGTETWDSQVAGATDNEAIIWLGATPEDPDAAGGWSVRCGIAEQNGKLVVRTLKIEPLSQRTPPDGITASLLRELSPASITRFAAAAAAQSDAARQWESVLQEDTHTFINSYVEPATTPQRGRPPLDDRLLAVVSLLYLDELKRGRGIYARMAEALHRRPETVRDWVHIARDRGWLTKTKQGRRGGSRGPRLIEFLEAQKK